MSNEQYERDYQVDMHEHHENHRHEHDNGRLIAFHLEGIRVAINNHSRSTSRWLAALVGVDAAADEQTMLNALAAKLNTKSSDLADSVSRNQPSGQPPTP